MKEFISISNIGQIGTVKNILTSESFGLALPVVDKVVDYVLDLLKQLFLKSLNGIGLVCIVVCGMSIMWFMINNKSNLAKEGFTGSIIVYIGTKILEIAIK